MRGLNETAFCTMESPVGTLRIGENAQGIASVIFVDAPADAAAPQGRYLPEACRQLEEYFAGARRTFTVPLAPAGTPFQRRVWSALSEIPFGETRSYGEIAAKLGKPGAARAVGGANGRNPICVIVPCHRVIAADGGLGGYSWGLDRKRFLLDLEAGAK